MKKIYLWAAMAGVFALGACSEDELPDNNGGTGGQEEPAAEVMVLTYDKFLQSNDVEITSPDTATISVSKAFLEANDIDATVGTTPRATRRVAFDEHRPVRAQRGEVRSERRQGGADHHLWRYG